MRISSDFEQPLSGSDYISFPTLHLAVRVAREEQKDEEDSLALTACNSQSRVPFDFGFPTFFPYLQSAPSGFTAGNFPRPSNSAAVQRQSDWSAADLSTRSLGIRVSGRGRLYRRNKPIIDYMVRISHEMVSENVAWDVGISQQEVDDEFPCISRKFDYSSFVCVCNASYCDTLPRPSVPREGYFVLYSSDMMDKRFSKSQGELNLSLLLLQSGSGDAGMAVEFSLETSVAYQTIIGWGGAITDAAAYNVLSLSPDAQERLLRSYFDVDGIEYNLVRINMGGCDFSWRKYTYADTEGDVDLETFALEPEDLDYKIPVIQKAKAISTHPLKIYASPWSAPPWMKTNADYCGYGKLRDDMYQPWAEYFVRFLDSYSANNVSIWGLTAQNEPRNGYVPGFFFNCMGWTADQQRKWIAENLGPTLEANGYGDVVLMIMDDQRLDLPEWAQTVLNDPIAAQYVDGIALHWYMDQYFEPGRLTSTHELYPDYFILGTEACEGNGIYKKPIMLGSWERLESYAHDIIVDMNHWVTGWTDWNIALDTGGGPNWSENFVDSPIIVNKTSDEFYKNPMFYAMGHFSKFVKEGALRIHMISQDPQGLEATAFQNPDLTKVIVILNRSKRAFKVNVKVKSRGIMSLSVGPRSLHTAIFK
ncbi:lysosomal acid glucosylceramidase-like [Macrobrachium nipponense]|uniref:lysosomal acid glucosylceramidase-like n=1 Tax=Macrobrachium nipponense TaxID=159736 RepID=UPI0030C8615D